MPPRPHIRVRVSAGWGDCDPAGVAFPARFYTWIDLASHALVREMGVAPADMAPPSLVGFPVVSVSARFLAPVALGDDLEVRSTVGRVGRSSFSLRHRVVRQADRAAVMEGTEERVYVRGDGVSLAPQPLTPSMRSVLERYLEVHA